MNATRRTKTFIGAMMLAAVSAAAYAGFQNHTSRVYLAAAILALAAATSRMKVRLPGVNGNMSMNLPFLLTAVVALSAAEASTIALLSTAVQCWPRKGKFNAQQMIFNLSMMVFASSLASLLVHSNWLQALQSHSITLEIVLATLTLFLSQTLPVAGIVALSEGKPATTIWWNVVHLSFPYYVVAAGLTTMVQAMSSDLGWGLALAVSPVMYGIYRSYRLYFGQLTETLPTQPMVKAAAAAA